MRVAQSTLHPRGGLPFMTLLACLFDPAKRYQRLLTGFLPCHAGSNVEFGLTHNMVAGVSVLGDREEITELVTLESLNEKEGHRHDPVDHGAGR
jgi:hypothetical protein